MAESRLQILNNGQQLVIDDVNLLGEVSGLADDRTISELFRMTPFDGASTARGILTYAHQTSNEASLVTTNGAAGSVLVNPFRAIIGSRTAVATDAKKNWRDIRSTIAVGTTTRHQVVSFAANASGLNRWDLVYLAVTVDANAASVTRKVKDPVTRVIAGATVVTTLVTTSTLGVVAGTPHATPAWPSAPADAGSTYYIPIAYVRVPNGFTAASTVANGHIAVVASTVHPRGPLPSGLTPATLHYTPGAFGLTAARIGSWGNTGLTNKPAVFVPPTLSGGFSLFLAIVTDDHANGDILDTRDWRQRLVRWNAQVLTDTVGVAWNTVSGAPRFSSLAATPTLAGASGLSNTLSGNVVAGVDPILTLASTNFDGMSGATSVGLSLNGSGQLILNMTGAPNAVVILWIDFSGRMDNA